MLFLLSLTHDQAIELDAFPRDSCADLTGDDESPSRSAGERPLMVCVRWNDVQRAKRELIREKTGLAILQLRAGGFSETEIARLSGRDRLAVRRRWHASIDEILERLGGEDESALAESHISMCLRCGTQPRARLAEIRKRVKGGTRIVSPERQIALCEVCAPPELQPRILHRQPIAA